MLFSCLLLYVGILYIRPSEIMPALEFVPLLQIVSGLSLVVAAFSYALRPRRFADLPQDWCLLALWAVIFLSNLFVWVQGAVEGFLDFLSVVFLYFLMRLAIETPKQFRTLLYWVLILSLFQAMNGIIEQYTGVGLGGVVKVNDRIRGTGIFHDPNDLALTLVMVVPFLLTMISEQDFGLFRRVIGVSALAPILTAIYYTNSRGGVLGLGAVFITYCFRRFGRIGAPLTSIALVLVLVAAAPSRSTEMTSNEESAQSRIQSWAAGWIMLKSSPVIGVGYHRYLDFHLLAAHNSFVHTCAELGLLGGICFVGMFYFYFRGLRGSRDAGPPAFPGANAWRRDLSISGIGVITCCWFLSRQYIAYIYLLLGAGAAFAALASPGATLGDRVGWRDIRNTLLLTLIGLVAVYVSIRTMAVWTG